MSQQVASHDEHSTDGGTAEMENVTALVPSRFVMCTLIRAGGGVEAMRTTPPGGQQRNKTGLGRDGAFASPDHSNWNC